MALKQRIKNSNNGRRLNSGVQFDPGYHVPEDGRWEGRTVQKVVTSDISPPYHYHDFMGSLPNFIILGYVLGHVGQHHRHF